MPTKLIQAKVQARIGVRPAARFTTVKGTTGSRRRLNSQEGPSVAMRFSSSASRSP